MPSLLFDFSRANIATLIQPPRRRVDVAQRFRIRKNWTPREIERSWRSTKGDGRARKHKFALLIHSFSALLEAGEFGVCDPEVSHRSDVLVNQAKKRIVGSMRIHFGASFRRFR